jgi:hypothetical protein|tara:strand:+ start:292 stop:525 length:234 start_codon:yes stop_codon:yes gene_type:complete
MKELKIKANKMSQKQWFNFILELNIIKKAWKPYGVDIQLQGSGIKKIINLGTKVNEYNKLSRKDRRRGKKLEQDQGF